MQEPTYPISEIFTSWQGEGQYAGTRMTFIRFAGCNVGKPIKGSIVEEFDSPALWPLPEPMRKTEKYDLIPVWQEECTTFDGRKFLCDTDFRAKEKLTAQEIISRIPKGVEHICFTGGEPLLHVDAIEKIKDLFLKEISWRFNKGKAIHIETSGTKLYDYSEHISTWITVSPKFNFSREMIIRANEIKFLVDDKFDDRVERAAESISDLAARSNTIIWLSPINGNENLNHHNITKAKEILERHPTWRLTQQSHKIWGVR